MASNGMIVETARDGDVLRLTLNRPKRLNALTPEVLRVLAEELQQATPDDTAVVINGNGRAFCAGYDLKDAHERATRDGVTPENARATAELMQSITTMLRRCPVPVIAQVHGYAVGGGTEIALNSDMVIAGESASFGFPETGAGLSVTNGVTSLLPRLVGLSRAKELIFLGEFFPAHTAERLGLVNRVVPDESLESTVEEVIDVLRTRVPAAIRLAKTLLNEGLDRTLSEALEIEIDAAVIAETSGSTQEQFKNFATNA